MFIPSLSSVKSIEKQFQTGEEPLLVVCSNMEAYICKYMRSGSSAYKLACELAGAIMAHSWNLNTPDIAFVHVRKEHWTGSFSQYISSKPLIGFKREFGVVDINPGTFLEVVPSLSVVEQLMDIALFDFWIANEDRNYNNSNLMYKVSKQKLVSIDYGCIFNTATFDYPMSQLTSTDTILYSDLFSHIIVDKSKQQVNDIVEKLNYELHEKINRCENSIQLILKALPSEWLVPLPLVESKLLQLFETRWINNVWNNFVECLKENC